LKRFIKFVYGFTMILLLLIMNEASHGASCGSIRHGPDPLKPAAGDSLKNVPVRHIITEAEIEREMRFSDIKGILSSLIGFTYGSLPTAVLAGLITQKGEGLIAGFLIGGFYFASTNSRNTRQSLREDAIEKLSAQWNDKIAFERCGQEPSDGEE